MGKPIRAVISITAAILIWEGVSRSGIVNRALFPPPTAVFRALVEMAESGELARDLQASIWRALVGFLAGSVAGIAAGLLTGRFSTLDAYVSPILQIFRPLPPVAIIPIIIIWFGIGEVSKVFSIAFAVFFPVWINTDLGARRVPHSFLWSAYTLGCYYPGLAWRVILPAAFPYIVGGLRVGIALAFVMVYVSELSGASAGIGYQISVSYLAYRVDRMLAAIAVLGALGFLSDLLMVKFLQNRFPWLKLDTSF
jgi:NitT/TauT family transport system permease protein/sulfonate transport system permease protein